MKYTINNHVFEVVHIMADGEVRDSVKGLVPPPETGCYEILNRMEEKMREKKAREGETA